MARSDLGGSHDLTPAGRDRCALAATRHGVYSLLGAGLLPRCGACPDPVRERCPRRSDDALACPLLGDFRDAVLAELSREFEPPGHLRLSDAPLVIEYANLLTVLARIDMILSAEGTEVKVMRETAAEPQRPGEAYARKSVGLDLHPLLAFRATLAPRVLSYAEHLGLSPMGRKRLDLGAPPPAKALTLEQIAEEARKDVADGQG